MHSRLAVQSFILACFFLVTPLFSYAHFSPATISAASAILLSTSETEVPVSIQETAGDTNDSDAQSDQGDSDCEPPSENLPPHEPDCPEADDSDTEQPSEETPDTPVYPPSPENPIELPGNDDELVVVTLPTDQFEEEEDEDEEYEEEEEEDEELEFTEVWDDEIFQVLLPTSLNLDFIIDPHGIFFLSNEEIADLDIDSEQNRLGRIVDDVFTPLPTAGQVIFLNHTAAHIENNGNHPIMLEIDFRLDIRSEHGDIIAVNSPNEVFSGEEHRIFIGASFSSPNVHAATHFGSNYLINNEAVPLLETSRTHQFILDGAMPMHYSIISPDNEIVQVGASHGLGTVNNMQFTFAGKCNPEADWSILGDSASIRISLMFRISN